MVVYMTIILSWIMLYSKQVVRIHPPINEPLASLKEYGFYVFRMPYLN